MLVLPIKQQMCPADFHHHQYQSSEPHHVHRARVHYCCVTGDRNLNCAVYTVSNVADDDANTYIYYTFIILHYTVRISLFTRPRAPLPGRVVVGRRSHSSDHHNQCAS